MKNIMNRPDRIPAIYGTLIALGLIVYLGIMYLIGLAHIIELRLLNIFIILAGVYYALKQYARTHAGHLNYFKGLVIGIAASTIGVFTFALILFFWLQLDQNLQNIVLKNSPMGIHLNPYISCAAIVIEGVFSGFFVTFILLNWVNTDSVNNPAEIEDTDGEVINSGKVVNSKF
jgi:hypothetical protein